MLKLAGGGLYRERLETIPYSPGIKNTGDLESGTHTIVPTSRPAIGSAQYSAQLTLPAPGDARMVLLRIAARLSVNIVSLGTATHVYCSVRVDVDDAANELFNEDWTSSGAKLNTVDTHSGNKAALFNLLKDGATHTFYFLFWADVASQAQIDVVQLWEEVGNSTTSPAVVIQLTHTGLIFWMVHLYQEGTGAAAVRVQTNGFPSLGVASEYGSQKHYLSMIGSKLIWYLYGTVATDLNYINAIITILRSEQ